MLCSYSSSGSATCLTERFCPINVRSYNIRLYPTTFCTCFQAQPLLFHRILRFPALKKRSLKSYQTKTTQLLLRKHWVDYLYSCKPVSYTGTSASGVGEGSGVGGAGGGSGVGAGSGVGSGAGVGSGGGVGSGTGSAGTSGVGAGGGVGVTGVSVLGGDTDPEGVSVLGAEGGGAELPLSSDAPADSSVSGTSESSGTTGIDGVADAVCFFSFFMVLLSYSTGVPSAIGIAPRYSSSVCPEALISLAAFSPT